MPLSFDASIECGTSAQIDFVAGLRCTVSRMVDERCSLAESFEASQARGLYLDEVGAEYAGINLCHWVNRYGLSDKSANQQLSRGWQLL